MSWLCPVLLNHKTALCVCVAAQTQHEVLSVILANNCGY